MIERIAGKIIEVREQSVIVEVNGIFYEILVPSSVLMRIDEVKDTNGNISLITYHYLQVSPSSANPVLVGFISNIERDFFLQFIKVSGIGPRAAVKALNKPISEITKAIEQGDINYLKTLPGIGMQRAKEIIAKLQGKIGKFGLIRDEKYAAIPSSPAARWQDDALEVLIQLQYKKQEALMMIEKALKRSNEINSTESLLNEIYKQRVNG